MTVTLAYGTRVSDRTTRSWIVRGDMFSARPRRLKRRTRFGVVGSGILICGPFLPFGRRVREVTCWPHVAAASRSETRQPLGIELDHGRDAVLDERLAVAVEHRAARRLDAQLAHAVVARLAQVLVAGEHLQVPEAEEHDAEQREREHAEDGHAQGELRGDGRHAPGAASVEGAHARLSGDRPPVV